VCDEFANQFEVADVAFDERVVRVARDVGDVGRVRGVGEAVEVDDRPAAANERTHDVAPNEPAAAGDERPHGATSIREWSPRVRRLPRGAPATWAWRPIIEASMPGQSSRVASAMTMALVMDTRASRASGPMAT